MAEPPVLPGAVQERSIWVAPLAVAERPVGAPGALVAVVRPVPATDQSPSPSALVARTCTSYDVSAARLPMAALVPVTFCGPSVKFPLVPARYCTS